MCECATAALVMQTRERARKRGSAIHGFRIVDSCECASAAPVIRTGERARKRAGVIHVSFRIVCEMFVMRFELYLSDRCVRVRCSIHSTDANEQVYKRALWPFCDVKHLFLIVMVLRALDWVECYCVVLTNTNANWCHWRFLMSIFWWAADSIHGHKPFF